MRLCDPALDTRQRAPRLARARPWVAVVAAAIIFALIPVVGLMAHLIPGQRGLTRRAGTGIGEKVSPHICYQHLRNSAVLGVDVALVKSDQIPDSDLEHSS